MNTFTVSHRSKYNANIFVLGALLPVADVGEALLLCIALFHTFYEMGLSQKLQTRSFLLIIALRFLLRIEGYLLSRYVFPQPLPIELDCRAPLRKWLVS